jgi:hypothetical protein
MLLPDVVVGADVGVELLVATGGEDVGPEATTAGFGLGCAVVVVCGAVLGGIVRDEELDCDAWVVCGTCTIVAEQTAGASASVLHLKSAGGGPGSRREEKPILAKTVSIERFPSSLPKDSLLACVDDEVDGCC